MNLRINKLAGDAVEQAMIVRDTVVGVSRAAANGTADLLASTKRPLRNAADAGLALNRISHKSVARLLKVQAKALERSVDAGAARLELAARAPSMRALVEEQLSLLPETRKRLSGDLRNTWKVIVDARSEITQTLRGEVSKPTRKKGKTTTRAAGSRKTTGAAAKKKAAKSRRAPSKRKTGGRKKAA